MFLLGSSLYTVHNACARPLFFVTYPMPPIKLPWVWKFPSYIITVVGATYVLFLMVWLLGTFCAALVLPDSGYYNYCGIITTVIITTTVIS